MCLFIAFCVLDQPETFQAMLDIITAFSGAPCTPDDVAELGKSVLRNERDFNMRAGMTNKDDRLPEYMLKEELAPHNVVFEVSDDELDQVHNF
jgi:aldehyde:ferredoxin oxidoreductase